MARINTYDLDQTISVDDLILGSSHEGVFNGNVIYKTRNYRLSDLAQFFRQYDFSNDISLLSIQQDLTALTTRVTTLENAGYLTEHPNITAASSVDNSGQFFIQDITLDANGHILSITSAEASGGSGGGGGGGTTDLTSFSVTTSPAGTASLVYNNTNGVFTYTPPDLSSYLTSVAFSDITSTPTTLAGYGITDAFDGAYSSLTGTPSVYTTTQVDNIFSGTTTIVGYNRIDWDNAYDNSITSMTVTGTSTKTITLNQQDGGTITATFTDISETGQGNITDTNDFVTSGSFSNGTLTLQIQNQSNVNITGFDARYYTETEVDNLITNFISLSSISVGANAQPSGNGGIAYNDTSGVFTYTPPDFSGSYLPTTGGTLTGDLILASGADLTLQGGDVSITGNLSLSGSLTAPTFTGNLRGDLYSITGSTAATKVLETGAGSSPDTYYIGDLRNNQTDTVFDTSLTMFRKDVKIGDYDNSLGGGAENLDLYLGATSSIFFGTGIAQKELSATIISDFNFAVFSTITGVSLPNGVLTLRTKGADENEPGYSNYTVDLQTYFDDRYVELAGDTMTGNLSFSLESIGVVGNIFNTNGTKILENGSNTQTAYLVGNVAGDIIESDLTTVIFDSSEDAFTRDINIGVPGTNGIISDNFDIDLGVTSQIYFGRGITQQQQYVSASKISIWDSNVITSTYYDLVGTNNDEIQIRIVKDNDPNSYITTSNNITGGTYINITSSENPGTETDGHDSNDPIVLNVDTEALDALYVNIDGDTMTNNLSFSTENVGVVGNIFNTNGSKILENGSSSQTAYFVGNVSGDIIQSDLSTVIFDSSEDAFTRGINIGVPGSNNIITDNFDIDLGVTSEIYFGRGITSGANQEQYVSGAKISQWNAANEKHITNMEFQEGGTGNEGKFELFITAQDSGQNRTTDFLIEQGSNITMSITERVSQSGQGAINISAKLATSSTDGLITKSQLSNFGVSSLTAGGTLLNGGIEILGSNGISVSGDGTDSQISIAANNATTSNVGVVQLATVAQAEDLSNNNTSNNVITLETLDAALAEEITIPTLQQVTNSGDVTNHDIHIVGSQQEMLLTRVTTNTGNNNIATFDTFSSQGYIQVGSQISSSQNYGYIGHSSSGLHLSKVSGTGNAIIINSSDNVSMGGNLSVSGTLTTTGVASLDGGINVDDVFTVGDGTGNVSTSGTLSSGNTSVTGTLTVSTTSDLQGAVTANSLTVTNNSTLNTVSLGGDLTPSVDSTHDLGTSALRFANVYTDNLNGVDPSNFADKGTTTNQEFDANVIAPDFQLTSDERLKENIIDLKPRKINVDFKEYNFKDTKQTRFGVVAQEVEKHHPEFIKESESGYKSVSYIDLLVAKIVELEDRIKQLENA